MDIRDKLTVIYLIGLVLFTSLVYLTAKDKNQKNLEWFALIIGALWIFFLPYGIVREIMERRQR